MQFNMDSNNTQRAMAASHGVRLEHRAGRAGAMASDGRDSTCIAPPKALAEPGLALGELPLGEAEAEVTSAGGDRVGVCSKLAVVKVASLGFGTQQPMLEESRDENWETAVQTALGTPAWACAGGAGDAPLGYKWPLAEQGRVL